MRFDSEICNIFLQKLKTAFSKSMGEPAFSKSSCLEKLLLNLPNNFSPAFQQKVVVVVYNSTLVSGFSLWSGETSQQRRHLFFGSYSLFLSFMFGSMTMSKFSNRVSYIWKANEAMFSLAPTLFSFLLCLRVWPWANSVTRVSYIWKANEAIWSSQLHGLVVHRWWIMASISQIFIRTSM